MIDKHTNYIIITCAASKKIYKNNSCLNNYPIIPHSQFRLASTLQYFGTIICDRLHGIMRLYIDKH